MLVMLIQVQWNCSSCKMMARIPRRHNAAGSTKPLAVLGKGLRVAFHEPPLR